jgi:AcrR family transcriptional regulator
MDTARRLFAAEGYYAVSMRRIADAIEYSPAAIYVHFKDKEALIRELCTEDFGKLAAEFMQLANEEDPVERIRRSGMVYIRFAVEHPNHYRLMFMTEMDVAPSDEIVASMKGNPESDAYAFLFHSVTEAMSAGRFRREHKDAELLTQTFWAIVHGVASLQVAKGNDPWVHWKPIEDRARSAIEAALHGMLASPVLPKMAKKKSLSTKSRKSKKAAK